MPVVELDSNEWNQVITIIAKEPWTIANPLLMKISQQLRLPDQPTIVEGKNSRKTSAAATS